MSLGERICKFRTRKNLSQGDLADALEVSRQSISKWETNASVPELDKLVKLSEVFEVSLDELVTGKEPKPKEAPASAAPQPEPKVSYVERQATRSAHKTVGAILLCFAALIWLLVSLLVDVLSGLMLASPFVTCGLICLFARKNVGLWCMWAVYGFVDIYLRFGTGANWGFVFSPIAYQGGWEIHLIVSWIWLACFAGMTLATVLRLKNAPAGSMRKNAIFTAAFWAAFFLLGRLLPLPKYSPELDVETMRVVSMIRSAFGIVRDCLLVTALAFTGRLIHTLRNRKKT